MKITDYSRYYFYLDSIQRGDQRAIQLRVLDCVDILKLFRGELKTAKPIQFKVECGQKRRDVLTASWKIIRLVREPIADLLEANGLTGWRRYPVEIRDRKGKRIRGYCGLAITGKGMGIDEDRSESVVFPSKHPWEGEVERLKGLFLKDDFYDGSDFFNPEGTALIMTTKKARDVLASTQDIGRSLVPLSEYTWTP